MSLENSKAWYGAEARPTLKDKAYERLNLQTPHQAPQRLRVSRSTIPGSRSSSARGSPRPKNWRNFISPEVNMGVPTLMLLLEPNVVWDHTKGYVNSVGKEVESAIGPADFFDGWHKAGRLARGVYEGSYWDLMGDCEDLMDMLRKLSRAPPLQEEPPLDLPAQADLPKWDDFKPSLGQVPAAATLPVLKLPPFRSPILETEVPFLDPQYVALPEVPEVPQEDMVPTLIPPEFVKVAALDDMEYVEVEPPIYPEAPKPPHIGDAAHGHDWSGNRPFVLPEPVFQAPALLKQAKWVHPPAGLPKPPSLEPIELDRAQMDLQPAPWLQLAWESGPEPEPSYASKPCSPRILSPPRSRAGSPPRSRPGSARPPSRPASAHAPPPPPAPAAAEPAAALEEEEEEAAEVEEAAAAPPGLAALPAAPPVRQVSVRSVAPPAPPSAVVSAAPSASSSRRSTLTDPMSEQWEAVRDVVAGAPRMWIDFKAPFADLPPVFIPPRPEPNSDEPEPDDFPHEALDQVPAFLAPEQLAETDFEQPVWSLPEWRAPCEPRPIGFLRGGAPVLIMDVSGTMHPFQRGRFTQLKDCVCELLSETGELATAAIGFDVIAFCSGAWSWSDTYEARLSLLQASQSYYSGRQAGSKLSGIRASAKARSQRTLQPTEPDLLKDAHDWVANWPAATGQTCMLSAFKLAEDHWYADSWILFSDGLARDTPQCLELLEQRRAAGLKIPAIHCVGFFPEGTPTGFGEFAGERNLRHIAESTGGTFQWYNPTLHRVYDEDANEFRPFDIAAERPEETNERLWAEATLRGERKKNLRLGIAEGLDVTLARVRALHEHERVQPAAAAQQRQLQLLVADHQARNARVIQYNAEVMAEVQAQHAAVVAAIEAANQVKIRAAREAYEAAHAKWLAEYDFAVREWEANVKQLESQRDGAWAAREAEAAASGKQLRGNRPASASRALLSRPGSAVPRRVPLPRPGSARPEAHEVTRTASSASATQDEAVQIGIPPRPVSRNSRSNSGGRAEAAAPAGQGEADEPLVSAGSNARPVSGNRGRNALQRSGSSKGHGQGGEVEPLSETVQAEESGVLPDIVEDDGEDDDAAIDDGGDDFDADGPMPAPGASKGGGGGGASRPVSGARSRPTSARPSSASGAPEADGSGTFSPRGATSQARPMSARVKSIIAEETGISPQSPTPPRPISANSSSRPNSASRDGATTTDGTAAAAPASGALSANSRPSSASGRPTSRPPSARPGSASRTSPEGYVVRQGTAGVTVTLHLSETEAAAAIVAADMAGEDSHELKRHLFPPEVVDRVEAENAAKLDEIREAWGALYDATDEANRRKLEAQGRNKQSTQTYRDAVYACYADSFIKDVLMGGSVLAAADVRILEGARAEFEKLMDDWRAENARVAALHAAEVADKVKKEASHKLLHERWEVTTSAIKEQYEATCKAARETHDANVQAAKHAWKVKCNEVDALNERRLQEAQAVHEELIADVKQRNKAYKVAFSELIQLRSAAEAENVSRLQQAKVEHRQRLEELAKDNEQRLTQAHAEHQELCERLQEEHGLLCTQAQIDHEEMTAFVTKRNEALIAEARARFALAVAQATALFEKLCAAARAAHAKELARIQAENAAIWPKVQVARLAQAELARVMLFAEHIRFCANKFEMGVNFAKNTPNYDRVVEMQALREALAKAFPDYSSKEYPWPDHDRRGEKGTGWVSSPQPKSITYVDPAAIIQAMLSNHSTPRPGTTGSIAARRHGERPAFASARGARSGGALSDSGVADGSASAPTSPRAPHTPLQLPVDQLANNGGDLESPATSRVRFATLGAAADGAAGAATESTPAGAGVAAVRARPRSAPDAHHSAAGSVAGSTSEGRAATAGSGTMPPGRFASQMASSAGGAPRPQSAFMAQRPVCLRAPPPRPGAYMAARVAANLTSLQGAMSQHPGSARSASAGSRPTSAVPPFSGVGFAKDMPRVKYAEVAVEQMMNYEDY